MAQPHYYTNGIPRWDDNQRPNPSDKQDGPYLWWDDVPDNLNDPAWDQEPHAIVARRELFRSMGGKPTNYTPQQMQQWKSDAAALVWYVRNDPCAAFSSKPDNNEGWNWTAWAAFCNWYWWLSPQNRWPLLQDIGAGRCNVWMPVALEMRRRAPPETMNDPLYLWAEQNLGWDSKSVQLSGDDPARFVPVETASTSDYRLPREDYVTPCQIGMSNPMMCFQGYPANVQWPIVDLSGIPVAIAGIQPCTPFPQCVAQYFPPGLPYPCEPWPGCLFNLAESVMGASPNTKMLRTAEGGTYLPVEPDQGPQPAPPPSAKGTPSWVVAALVATLGIGALAAVVSTGKK